ncbi:MAG: serine acetyltransferase [Pseudoflavonifractor sp.]|nr:serine acetyltransferase [Pseudoflavonifractor sp.]
MGTDERHVNVMKAVVDELSQVAGMGDMCHMRWRGEPLPSEDAIKMIIRLSRAVIFPGFFGDSNVDRFNIAYHMGINVEKLYEVLVDQITAGLCLVADCDRRPDVGELSDTARRKAEAFIARLPELRRLLYTDVTATYNGDPAAVSNEEVIYCYPAIRAISNYRIAHELVTLDVPVIPRMISEQAHSETGIDIHPAATIGESFTIDHGTGVVVGATAIIGNNVKIYQGVTLGAKSFDLDENNNPVKGIPRHPIIGDNVIIYSNTSILGRITVGANAVIGGNIWVTENVAEGEKLVQAKADNIVRLKQ